MNNRPIKRTWLYDLLYMHENCYNVYLPFLSTGIGEAVIYKIHILLFRGELK